MEPAVALAKLMHWVDVAWFFVIVAFTGGVNSFLFLFFFFAILVSSLRWGLDEGARVTICSVTLFISCALRLPRRIRAAAPAIARRLSCSRSVT